MSSPGPLGTVSSLENHLEHVRAIGMISIEIINLDMEMGGLLGALLRVSRELGQVIYLTPRSAMGRIQIVENVAHKILKPESGGLARIDDLIKRAEKLVGRRHQMIHEAWGKADLDSDLIYRVTLPKGDSKLVPLEELTSMISRIRVLIYDINQEIQVVIAAWPKPLQGTPRAPIPGGLSLESPHGQKHPTPKWLRLLQSFLNSLRRQ